MAESIVGAISAHLECAICYRRFENAKCLKCLHTFCESCINKVIYRVLDSEDDEFFIQNHVRCPVCREETKCRAEILRPNLLANKLIEELKRHEDSESTKELCKEHGAEKKFFCEKCGVLICSECALCTHGKHTFLIKNVEDASKAKVDGMVKLMSKATMWMASHQEFFMDYTKKKVEGNKRLDDISEAIQTSSSTCLKLLTDTINRKKENLMTKVESNRSDLNEAVDNILGPVVEAISEVSDEIECAEELLDSSDPKEVVLQYRDWAKRLLRGIDQQIPSDMDARRQCTRVGSLKFFESKAPILDVPQLGVLWGQVPERKDQDTEMPLLQRPTQRLLLTLRVQVCGRIKLMTPYTNGSILVRYRDGHMEVLSPDGSCGRIRGRSTNISARDMAALSDGRFVTLTKRNTVKIYGKGGESQQVEFATREDDDESADAIATDIHDNVLLLYSGVARVVRFSSDGGEPMDVIPINCVEFNVVLRMRSTTRGKIVIVQNDGFLIACSDEGGMYRRIPIPETDKVSCDQEGNIWMISHQDIQGTKRAFLEVYGENGDRIVDTYLPNDSAAPEFEPWGIAASTNCFAAVLSPNEVGWFIREM
eukprot:XP_011675261.1 PREDICTED: uncharacterized protein LOC105443603 [Strongylocentrotus purpuratus]